MNTLFKSHFVIFSWVESCFKNQNKFTECKQFWTLGLRDHGHPPRTELPFSEGLRFKGWVKEPFLWSDVVKASTDWLIEKVYLLRKTGMCIRICMNPHLFSLLDPDPGLKNWIITEKAEMAIIVILLNFLSKFGHAPWFFTSKQSFLFFNHSKLLLSSFFT